MLVPMSFALLVCLQQLHVLVCCAGAVDEMELAAVGTEADGHSNSMPDGKASCDPVSALQKPLARAQLTRTDTAMSMQPRAGLGQGDTGDSCASSKEGHAHGPGSDNLVELRGEEQVHQLASSQMDGRAAWGNSRPDKAGPAPRTSNHPEQSDSGSDHENDTLLQRRSAAVSSSDMVQRQRMASASLDEDPEIAKLVDSETERQRRTSLSSFRSAASGM